MGAAVLAIHLAFSWYVIVRIGAGVWDPTWQTRWFVFFIPDFPSVILWLLLDLMVPDWTFSLLGQFGHTRAFIIPAICFGIVAPIYWFFVPPLLSARAARIRAAVDIRRNLKDASRRSYWVGAALLAIHLAFSWYVIARIGSGFWDALWQAQWLVFFVPDFPIFFLVLLLNHTVPGWVFPLPGQFGLTHQFIIPAICFGVVAPICWFFVPPLLSARAARKRAAIEAESAGAGLPVA